MKIRNGFVSNSSSSSYIVKIKGIDLDEMIERLQPEYAWHWTKDQELARLKKYLKNNEEDLEKEENCNEEKFKWMKKYVKNNIERLKKDIEMLESTETFKEVFLAYLKLNYIKVSESDGAVELNGYTIMHNSFDEGVPEMLKEIALFFMFDTDYTVKCKREPDGYRDWEVEFEGNDNE